MRTVSKWKWTTTATYWAAVLTAMKLYDIQMTQNDRIMQRYYEKKARCEIHNHPKPMAKETWWAIWRARRSFQDEIEVAALVSILVAWHLGQRIGDVQKVGAEDVVVVRMHDLSTICITIRHGKTTGAIGPFTLHLSLVHKVGKLFSKYWRYKKMAGAALFASTQEEQRLLAYTTRNILKSFDPQLELRSIRRGGLTDMALRGTPLQEIREFFSKHTTEKVLLGYLDWGTVSLAQAQKQIAIASRRKM